MGLESPRDAESTVVVGAYFYNPKIDSLNPHSALQLLRQALVTKTRQFSDTTNRNSLTAAA